MPLVLLVWQQSYSVVCLGQQRVDVGHRSLVYVSLWARKIPTADFGHPSVVDELLKEVDIPDSSLDMLVQTAPRVDDGMCTEQTSLVYSSLDRRDVYVYFMKTRPCCKMAHGGNTVGSALPNRVVVT